MTPFEKIWPYVKGSGMQKVDGFYLYQVGAALQPLKNIRGRFSDDDLRGTTYEEASYSLRSVRETLQLFLDNKIYRLKTSLDKGQELLNVIDELIKKIENDTEKNKLLDWSDTWPISNAIGNFEAVLSSELALLDLYVITKKGNFDTSGMMVSGEDCFPKDLKRKVPECIPDIQAGAKCIAVSLPTAAGFHLLRANEAILRRYWDVVTDGAERPSSGNMGDYINQLEQKKKGDPHVLAALKNLKNLHRNELIHPGDILETVDEAIALMNQIYTVVVYMLKAIPEQKQKDLDKPDYGGIAAALMAPVSRSGLIGANSDLNEDERASS